AAELQAGGGVHGADRARRDGPGHPRVHGTYRGAAADLRARHRCRSEGARSGTGRDSQARLLDQPQRTDPGRGRGGCALLRPPGRGGRIDRRLRSGGAVRSHAPEAGCEPAARGIHQAVGGAWIRHGREARPAL
ncbi:MAG: hypothetical protein AVDCRST_MAG51-2386, partial [uncultured Ramlibacter sp.]